MFISPLFPGLKFLGEATVSEYESLLLSLSYNNTAREPTPGNRQIEVTLSDGLHSDITVIIVIVVLNNDNPIMIEAATRQLTFTEGDNPLDIGQRSGIVLIDADREPLVTSLVVTLENPREPDKELLVIDISPVENSSTSLVSGLEITVNLNRSLQAYQVSLKS